ncbi:hypothetical protein RN001_006736 [Aquatica leii]|uniref:Uncharacterized protein n=1 Tax=Aquatica leii TaxID=1421715 RepID=A0AAN7Q605_9COLE|nr:hypothetical protein RN001_006736 [Aquatica leii]
MASDKMRCVFYKGKNNKIILFVGKKLKKCQEVLSVRVKYKLKYNNTKLPTQINETDGYHRQCYSSFTALIAKYRDLLSETDYASNSMDELEGNAAKLDTPKGASNFDLQIRKVTTRLVLVINYM